MIRLPNLRQPSGARPRIDRTNPIARGLAYWTLPGFASPGQITVGTSFRTTPADGVVRGFGSTFGTGSTDSLEVPFNTHSTQRTFIVSCYLNGGGGSSLGRLFDKRVSGAQTEILFFNSSTNEINFGAARSVSAGQWVTSFSTGRRAVIAVTYDASSTANDPVIYIDGSPVTITETLTPNGTITTNTDNYVLGNRKNDNARNLDGWIGSFFVWDRILSPAEVFSFSKNQWQIFEGFPLPAKTASGGYSLTASGGTLTLTGGNATLTKSSALTAQGGTLSLTGGNATLAKALSLTAHGGTLSRTGGNATLAKASVLTAQGGTLTLTGGDADLTHETPGAYTMTALGGTLSLTGGDAVLTYSGEPARRRGVAFKKRKNYIIKGKKYYLTDDELALVIARELADISRKDVKTPVKGRIKPIAASAFQEAKSTATKIVELAKLSTDDEEEDLILYLL